MKTKKSLLIIGSLIPVTNLVTKVLIRNILKIVFKVTIYHGNQKTYSTGSFKFMKWTNFNSKISIYWGIIHTIIIRMLISRGTRAKI